jgi:hypothetical protein
MQTRFLAVAILAVALSAGSVAAASPTVLLVAKVASEIILPAPPAAAAKVR